MQVNLLFFRIFSKEDFEILLILATVHFQIMPSIHDMDGRIVPDIKKKSSVDQICKNIFLGKFDPDLPYFTKKGSFWTGNEYSSKVPLNGNTKSMLIVPISVENENIGFLQLISTSLNFFRKKMSSFIKFMIFLAGFNAICTEIRDMYRFSEIGTVSLDFKLVHEQFRVTWIIYELSRLTE